jgi:hypothetical protein
MSGTILIDKIETARLLGGEGKPVSIGFVNRLFARRVLPKVKLSHKDLPHSSRSSREIHSQSDNQRPMSTTSTGAGIDPPQPQNERSTRLGGSIVPSRHTTFESLKLEADRCLMQWLRFGANYYRRLAHAATDTARKSP